jgi:hypothetical protein
LQVTPASPNLTPGYDVAAFTHDLPLVISALGALDIPNVPEGLSPFGVGFLMFTPIEVLDRVFPCDGLTPHPAAIWLFVGPFEDWIHRIRELSPHTIIFAQISSVQVM